MNEVITIFQGTVPAEQWPAFETEWNGLFSDRPAALLHRWLIQSVDDEETWCSIGLWSSRQAFTEYQSSVEHLPDNLLLRSFGGAPVLAAFEVAAEG